MRDTLTRWWRRRDHFEWLSGYIAEHGLQPVTRLAIGGSSAVLGLVAGTLPLSTTGPHSAIAEGVLSSAGTSGVVMGGLWLSGWPSRRASLAFALAASALFSGVCLAQASSVIGLMGCCAFATIGGYIAFFHTPRLLAYHLALAATTIIVLTARVIADHDAVLGACLAGLIGTVDLSVPFVILILMHSLRIDVLASDRDPLTYLLNRRGFDRAARTLLAAPRHSEAHLVVLMVDLDRFKVLNDDLGHAAGDQALIAVADVLREHAGSAAVIGRVGGEEFLVAHISTDPEPVTIADQLCHSIAATAYPITASIGTSAATLRTRGETVHHPALTTLIDSADAAMYEAKRRGGNRTHHSASLTGIDGGGPPVPSAGAAS